MKENTNLLFEEMKTRRIEHRKPEIERMVSEIEHAEKELESTEPKFKYLTDYRKYLADLIDDNKERIKNVYKQAENSALFKNHQAQPWSKRILNIKSGPQSGFNALKKIRDDIVIEEVNHRIAENPDKSLTAIYEEMEKEARDHRKRCSARTIRRIYESVGHN